MEDGVLHNPSFPVIIRKEKVAVGTVERVLSFMGENRDGDGLMTFEECELTDDKIGTVDYRDWW